MKSREPLQTDLQTGQIIPSLTKWKKLLVRKTVWEVLVLSMGRGVPRYVLRGQHYRSGRYSENIHIYIGRFAFDSGFGASAVVHSGTCIPLNQKCAIKRINLEQMGTNMDELLVRLKLELYITTNTDTEPMGGESEPNFHSQSQSQFVLASLVVGFG
jgi:hypothetical protein